MKLHHLVAAGSVKEEPIQLEGSSITVLPATMFRVELGNGEQSAHHLADRLTFAIGNNWVSHSAKNLPATGNTYWV